MNEQIENLTIDYLLSINPYALVKKAWLDKDEHGYKACYVNADGEQTDTWLATHSEAEAVEKMKKNL